MDPKARTHNLGLPLAPAVGGQPPSATAPAASAPAASARPANAPAPAGSSPIVQQALQSWHERLLGTTSHPTALGRHWAQTQGEIDRLRFHPALRRRWAAARAEAAVRNGAASAQLAGMRTSPEIVRSYALTGGEGNDFLAAHWRMWAFAIEQWPALGQAHARTQLPPSRLALTAHSLVSANGLGAAAPPPPPAGQLQAHLQTAFDLAAGSDYGLIRAGLIAAEIASIPDPAWVAVAPVSALTALVDSYVDPTGLNAMLSVAARDPLSWRGALRAYQRADVPRWLEYWIGAVTAGVAGAEAIAAAVLAGSATPQCDNTQ